MRLEDDLKPHNKETYEKVKNILRSKNKTCIIQPTGSGKSFLILKLIEDYAEQNRDIIVIEPQKYIFNQLKEKMKKYELPIDNVKFITYSALGKMENENINQFVFPNLVLVDEMHRAGAPKWGSGLQMLFDSFPNDCKYIGFSATPIRFLDGKRNMAEELFDGCIANEIGFADAILDRILPLPRYIAGLYTYDNEVNAIKKKIQKSHNPDEEKKKLLQKVAIMKKNLDKSKGISSIFKKYINQDKGKYIAFCRNITHLKQMRFCLEEWFSEAGIAVNLYEVHCKNPKNDKQFKDFMSDDKMAVCLSVAMLTEGVHGIDGVILLRDTISPNLYYQQIGRAFSVNMDSVPIIFDLVANCESVMDCSLKSYLFSAIEKMDRENRNSGGIDNNFMSDADVCIGKEITKEDIENFFVFDQVMDAINTFRGIEENLIFEGKTVYDDGWTAEDKKKLIEYYPQIGLNVKKMLSRERSRQSIMCKANALRLIDNKWTDKKIEVLMENYSKYGATGIKKRFLPEMSIDKIRKMAIELGLIYKGNRWDDESKIFLTENYKKLSKKELAIKLNRTEASIIGMVQKLDLKRCKN